MPRVRLLPVTPETATILAEGREAVEAALGVGIGGNLDLVREVVAMNLALPDTVRAGEHWGGYLATDEAIAQLVGICGYKGGSREDGSVEIAYGTLRPFEGRGYATAMAAALAAEAGRRSGVRTVIAHTLPGENASANVLRRNGFRCMGETIDPEDGRVWRWERPIHGSGRSNEAVSVSGGQAHRPVREQDGGPC